MTPLFLRFIARDIEKLGNAWHWWPYSRRKLWTELGKKSNL